LNNLKQTEKRGARTEEKTTADKEKRKGEMKQRRGPAQARSWVRASGSRPAMYHVPRMRKYRWAARLGYSQWGSMAA
jgi:hypothetical protein